VTPSKPGLGLILWNLISLNMGWWSTVFAAVHGWPWVGPGVIAVLVAIHLTLVPQRKRELATMGAAAVFGYIVDSIMVLAGVFDFPAAARLGAPSTVWMVTLWVHLATALNLALYWLVKRPRLGAVLGAIAGPIAYTGGWKLGGLVLPEGPWILALAVSAQWAMATPIVLKGAVWIGRVTGQPATAEAERRSP